MLAGLACRGRAEEQELEPRSYVNTPVGMNFLIAGYAYTTGNLVLSAASAIEDAEIETHSAFLGYVRALDVWGRYNSIKLYGSTGVYSRSGSSFDALGIAGALGRRPLSRKTVAQELEPPENPGRFMGGGAPPHVAHVPKPSLGRQLRGDRPIIPRYSHLGDFFGSRFRD